MSINKQFMRITGEQTKDRILDIVENVNKNKDFIYKVNKVILYGKYIRSNGVTDLDMAVFVKLKNTKESERDQNIERYHNANTFNMLFNDQLDFGKTEVFTYIRNELLKVQVSQDVESENITSVVSYMEYEPCNEIIFENE